LGKLVFFYRLLNLTSRIAEPFGERNGFGDNDNTRAFESVVGVDPDLDIFYRKVFPGAVVGQGGELLAVKGSAEWLFALSNEAFVVGCSFGKRNDFDAGFVLGG